MRPPLPFVYILICTGKIQIEKKNKGIKLGKRREWEPESGRALWESERGLEVSVWESERRSHWNLCFENEMSKCKAQQREFPFLSDASIACVCVCGSVCACISEFPVLSYAAFPSLLFHSNRGTRFVTARIYVNSALSSPPYIPLSVLLSPFFRTLFAFCCSLFASFFVATWLNSGSQLQLHSTWRQSITFDYSIPLANYQKGNEELVAVSFSFEGEGRFFEGSEGVLAQKVKFSRSIHESALQAVYTLITFCFGF